MSRIDSEPEVLGILESFKYMHQLMFFLRRNYSVVYLRRLSFEEKPCFISLLRKGDKL